MVSFLLILTPSQQVTGDRPYHCTECSLISFITRCSFHSKASGDEVQDEDRTQRRGWQDMEGWIETAKLGFI
jgi:hypothetical protein